MGEIGHKDLDGRISLAGGAKAVELDDLLAGLKAAMPFDGVLLALHGAMVTDDDDDPDGATTECPNCQTPVIRRDWYQILDYRMTARGTCPECDTAIPGRFRTDGAGTWGRKRLRVWMNQ